MKEFDRFSFPRNYSGKLPLFFRKFPEKFRRKFPEISELTTLVANQLHFEVQFICFMKEFETVKVSNRYDHRVWRQSRSRQTGCGWQHGFGGACQYLPRLPIHRVKPPFGRYQITLLGVNNSQARRPCVQHTTCWPRVLPPQSQAKLTDLSDWNWEISREGSRHVNSDTD